MWHELRGGKLTQAQMFSVYSIAHHDSQEGAVCGFDAMGPRNQGFYDFKSVFKRVSNLVENLLTAWDNVFFLCLGQLQEMKLFTKTGLPLIPSWRKFPAFFAALRLSPHHLRLERPAPSVGPNTLHISPKLFLEDKIMGFYKYILKSTFFTFKASIEGR